jgi:hypothetical protein
LVCIFFDRHVPCDGLHDAVVGTGVWWGCGEQGGVACAAAVCDTGETVHPSIVVKSIISRYVQDAHKMNYT